MVAEIVVIALLVGLAFYIWRNWEYKLTESEAKKLNSREVRIITHDIQIIQSKLIDFNEKHRKIAEKIVKCIASIEKLTNERIVTPGSLFNSYFSAMTASDFEFIGKANTYIISILTACNSKEEQLEAFMSFAKSPSPNMLDH